MKNDIGHFYDTVPLIDINGFAELFLSGFALNNRINQNQALIPCDYKKYLASVMNSEIDDRKLVNQVIDPVFYYENREIWERELETAIRNYINDANDISVSYDPEFDEMILTFSKDRINNIKSIYDEDILNIMRTLAYYVKMHEVYTSKCYGKMNLTKKKIISI